jgi:integrase
VLRNSKVTGRWHDHRHFLITDLAESGAGEQTIMDIAGHVSRNMLKRYSHIRMEAKRAALESLVRKQVKRKSLVSRSNGTSSSVTQPSSIV